MKFKSDLIPSHAIYKDNNTEGDKLHKKSATTLWHLGYRYLLRHLNPLVNKSILDYGCGNGTFCRFLYANNAIVTGVDISENMIKVAKEDYPDNISYSQISSGTLDFLPEGSFDFVISNFVFCTISTRQEIINVMKSIIRVLKNAGSFLILNPNWDKSNGKEFISFKLQYCSNLLSGQHVTSVIKDEPSFVLNDYYWSKADYFDFLTESGFEIHGINEPLAGGNEITWMAEKSFPPYHIIHAKKQID